MSEAAHRLAFTLRALRHRNYRLFFGGQLVSLCGTWMTNIATGWLVYRLTGSALALGVVTFCGQIPIFLLGPFAGTLVDRVDKRRALVVTQTLSMLQSFALAGVAFGDAASVAVLAALNLVQGTIMAFDIPMRQSFLVEMIEDRRDLGNAIALNSSMFNAARIAGPSLGAAVVAAFGEAWCFAIDGVSFLAVIASFLLMRVTPAESAGAHRGALADFLDGWRTVSRAGPIRSIIMLLALVSLCGAPFMTLMPLFASGVLGGDARTLGFLMSASGAGAFLGAIWLAGRRDIPGLTPLIPAAAGIFGLSIGGFALSRSVWLSATFIFLAGGCLMVQLASSNTILQTIVDDAKRGRVMSFYMMAFMGTAPFGSLLMGTVSEHTGPAPAVVTGGILCVLAAAAFLPRVKRVRSAIRPDYRQSGVSPESAAASGAASRLTFEARD